MSAARGPQGGRLSLEEYEALPHDDLHRDEVSRGWLVREPRPAHLHARVQLHLGALLDRHVRETNTGRVFTDAGYVLEADPLTLRGPDISFVDAARVPSDLYTRGYWRLAPDLAVEVLSPSNRRREMAEKVREYFAAGVRLVWVVDPATHTVIVHRPGVSAHILSDPDTRLTGDGVIPGFDVALSVVFDI